MKSLGRDAPAAAARFERFKFRGIILRELERSPEFQNSSCDERSRMVVAALEGEPRRTLQSMDYLYEPYWRIKHVLEDLYPPPETPTHQEFYQLRCGPQGLQEYYLQKVRIGTQLNIDRKEMVNALTQGMPSYSRNLLLIATPSSPSEWLTLARRIYGIGGDSSRPGISSPTESPSPRQSVDRQVIRQGAYPKMCLIPRSDQKDLPPPRLRHASTAKGHTGTISAHNGPPCLDSVPIILDYRHRRDGNSYPVQYYSRTLRKYERNYTITELECLAIIETVDRFKVYLAGNGFTIFTDHCALQWLKNIKNPTGRLFRWSLRLSVYDYQSFHHPYDPPILKEAHQKFNHPGISQLTRIISAQYFWSGMSIDIRAFVKNCNICQMSKTPKGPKYGELGELPESPLPFDLVSMDTIAGFARYGSAKKLPACSSRPRDSIRMDISISFHQYDHIYSSNKKANHPQANGLSERLNATLTGKLRLLHLQHPRASWTMLQSKVVKAYNDTPHSVTGFPPSYLMDGSLPKELSQHLDPYPSVTESRRLALQRTKERHKLDKIRFDKNHRSPDFEVGDLVLTKIYQHPNTGKLVPYFSGPYEIIENYASTLSNPFNHMNPDIFLDNVEPTLTARYISTPDTIPKIAIRLEPFPTTKIMLPSSPTRNHTPQISPQFSAPLINCDNTKLENSNITAISAWLYRRLGWEISSTLEDFVSECISQP
ncbi:K02A2.6-like [Cordylochernes scorpioides]|uniref:RNA-directed DNA polymerase n=1 Tax=Cordylochernes scorpioides TaxID=51811 RepID=A0ABY6KKZ6_9ARAC|nr:K02A2.6-like [Cordylochernes scorpioides]